MQIIVIALILFFSSSVWAQSYTKIDFGISIPSDSIIESSDLSASYNPGGTFQISSGKQQGNLLLELQTKITLNQFDRIKEKGYGSDNADGHLYTVNLLGNVIYAFSPNKAVSPYIGMGAGLSMVFVIDLNIGGFQIVNDNALAPAVQAIVGVSTKVNEKLSLQVEYNYFHAIRPRLQDRYGYDFTTSFTTSSLLFGITRHF